MKIIDNSSMYVDFVTLQEGDVFKAYDEFYFMKVHEFDKHGETYNAVNLESGYFDCFSDFFQVQELNATLTVK